MIALTYTMFMVCMYGIYIHSYFTYFSCVAVSIHSMNNLTDSTSNNNKKLNNPPGFIYAHFRGGLPKIVPTTE